MQKARKKVERKVAKRINSNSFIKDTKKMKQFLMKTMKKKF